MENTMDKDKQKDQENDKHVDEGAHVKMQGHLLIRDAETGEELVNKRNAIHFGNMAFVIANAMSYWQTENNGIYHMAFGNGGSDVLNTGEINYKTTNTGTIRDTSIPLLLNNSSSSPVSCISFTMSQPPINSSFTYN